MKFRWAVLLTTIVTLSACGVNNADENRGIYPKDGNSININEQADNYNDHKDDDQFGYVRQVKSPVPGNDSGETQVSWMNREKAALALSQILVALPNVNDASVIVTDQEVLVAYTTDQNDEKGRFETADQVKKSALNVVPRWYHVYITDDTALRQDVENIGSMNADSANKDESVKNVVNRMLERSPQGRKLNDGENPNGETFGGPNDNIDRTKYRQQFDEKQK
ncbi:YhcN/YlaJ family sporulation lipoprotein [Bacillus niameyensis]|uniref:YhcN/YlaJ family sporulation lipoprotein n=1 Tax=Bacillus niameyensis TaxID=1522308 RepID=UPI00078164A5|nr:YhcN/YlaJ family sporulation lipoprotein [Bacillus niameyensis]